MQFLITAIVAVILLVGVASSCPSACNCTDTSDGVDVDCSSRRLGSIPTDLPNNTNYLTLDNNAILVIEDNNFNNLPNLTHLNLTHNEISVIEDNNFSNLPNLQYLYLNQNKIKSIKSDTFNNLTKLIELTLHHNDISVIEDNNFNNLPNLKYLTLQNNDISVIKDNNFNNLPNLEHLLMVNNPISFVGENTFENLTQLTSLEFDMYCRGCNNIPFWRWLKRNQTFSTSVTCNDFDEKKLSNLQSNQVCSAATKSDDNYTAVYIGVGTFVATALGAVIIVLVTLRYRRQKKQQKRSTTREYTNTTFSGDM